MRQMKFPLLHNPYERFKFRVESDKFLKLLSIRFLNEFGLDVAETYPSSVNIHSITLHRVKDEGQVFLEINYTVEQDEFKTSATFTYHVNPNPDYITNVTNLETFILTQNENNQENLLPCP